MRYSTASLAMISTDKLSIDPALYVTVPEGNCKIIFLLDIHVIYRVYHDFRA
jgi:hypothetical protein